MSSTAASELTADQWEAYLVRKCADTRSWMTASETARLLYVTDETIRTWCKRGDFEYGRVAHRFYRISIRSIAQYLADHPGVADPR